MKLPSRDDLAFLACAAAVAILAAASGLVFLYIVAALLALLFGS